MKRCMYCGHENDDASETCVICGNQLMEMPAPETVPAADDPAREDGSSPSDQEEIPEIPMPEDITPDPSLYPDQEDPYGVPQGEYPQQGGYPQGDPYDQGQLYGGEAPYGGETPYGGYGYDPSEGQQQYGGGAYGYPADAPYGDNLYDPAAGYGQDRVRGDAQADALVCKKARRRIRNPIGFLAMLFFTVSVIASILNVALGHALRNISTVSHTITGLTGTNVAVNFMNSIVQMINTVNHTYLLIGGLVACIPSVLLMFGLWMAFTSTSAKKERVSTGGYSLSKAAIIIKFIGVCIVLLAAIVFAVAFVVSAGASSSMMSLIAGVIVLLVLILITVFAIMYYVQVLYAIKVIKANVKTGDTPGRIPGYAIFIGFVGCALTVLSMLPMAPDDYIGLAAHGAYAAWLLLISFWAIIYKATVKRKRA